MAQRRGRQNSGIRRVEILLENMLEGQRLARLDALMLLSFPLLIFGFTQLINLVDSYRTQTVPGLILALLALFILGNLSFLALFVRSYLLDSIFGRIRAFLWGICFSGAMLTLLVSAVSQPLVAQLLPDYSSNRYVSPLPSALSGMMVVTSIYILAAASGAFSRSMSRWLGNNVPKD